ncbi:hypothetical protein DMN91_012356 [Ooceraea biroi]|uniref:Transmembrane protein n=1 Tax=Ooceraea biroi TaxID=2015173 RepID=A0A3L8D4D6_OOCBI|nr:hypothetical protein DMN91_012356 [Ooceraea biroi]
MCVSMTTLGRRGFSAVSRNIARLGSTQPRYPNRSDTSASHVLSRWCPATTSSLPRIIDISRVLRQFQSGNWRTFCSAKTPISADGIIEALTKQQAKELASKLSAEERDLFLTALNESITKSLRFCLPGQLAAFRWRSKFGRPSKIPSLGEVDPTGTYCPVPDDWLNQKYDTRMHVSNLYCVFAVAIANAIPFVGFGFLDNFIMIVAGDQIEMMLNRRFPISTMAAAALGNTVSDVIGIGSVHYVEMFAQKGRVIGVTIGCIIGMTPIPIVALLHNNS